MVLEFFRDRSLKSGQKVKVYKNLNKDCFSIMDYKSRLVVAYADAVNLVDVTFQVSKAGQRNCRLKGHRNVHAFAVGTFLNDVPYGSFSKMDEFTYNPYENDTFVDRNSGESLENADIVFMVGGKYKYRLK